MFGRLSMDVFSSRLSPLKCLPTPYIASGLVTAGLLNLKHDPLVTLSIIAAVYGFSGGAVTSLVPAALAGFGDSREEVKLRNDVVHVLIGAAGLASGPAAGALLGRDFVWWLPIAFVTVRIVLISVLLCVQLTGILSLIRPCSPSPRSSPSSATLLSNGNGARSAPRPRQHFPRRTLIHQSSSLRVLLPTLRCPSRPSTTRTETLVVYGASRSTNLQHNACAVRVFRQSLSGQRRGIRSHHRHERPSCQSSDSRS